MNKNKAIQSISEIKNLMERSSKFISLSGLTGILVGVYSLIGAWFANQQLLQYGRNMETIFIIALIVVIASVITTVVIASYKSRKAGQKLFTRVLSRVVWNFSIPLIAGGIFCLSLIYHGIYGLISSVMLVFYGLTLINVSKFTFSNIGWLGYAFLALGLVGCFFPAYGLLFWAIGFGLFHIIYGILFYFLYERNN